jgi:hypothetical protein
MEIVPKQILNQNKNSKSEQISNHEKFKEKKIYILRIKMEN